MNRAVVQMDEMTQQNAALFHQAAAASQSMADRASMLNQIMEKYRIVGDRKASLTPLSQQSLRAEAA